MARRSVPRSAPVWRHVLHAVENREREEGSLNDPLIEQLRALEGEIRKNFAVSKTLREQLDEAVATEDYERAARLRDLIRLRGEAKR